MFMTVCDNYFVQLINIPFVHLHKKNCFLSFPIVECINQLLQI